MHDAILGSAIALIREVGYEALAMDAIAARAGVGKAAVYRRWRSKEPLVLEALDRIVRAIPPPDSGTTRGDLVAVMRSEVKMYQDPATRGLLSSLVSAMTRSPAIARAVRSGFHKSCRDLLRAALVRGVKRGEVPKGADLELALDLLDGPLFFRLLLTGKRIDERLGEEIVDLVLRAVGAKTPRRAGGSAAPARSRRRR